MIKIIAVAVGLMSFVSCTEAQPATNNVSQTTLKVVNPDEFKELLQKEDRQLVDVRTADEFAGGKIDDAVNIDFYSSDFSERFSDFDKDKPIMVYCAAGGRSAKASAVLKELGFKEIYDLSGGYNGWTYK